jgi:hypothetical protein
MWTRSWFLIKFEGYNSIFTSKELLLDLILGASECSLPAPSLDKLVAQRPLSLVVGGL